MKKQGALLLFEIFYCLCNKATCQIFGRLQCVIFYENLTDCTHSLASAEISFCTLVKVSVRQQFAPSIRYCSCFIEIPLTVTLYTI